MTNMWTLTERPFSFDDVVGNKMTVEELKKLSKDRNYPNVMIFSGPTGTGKTTSAFIVSALLRDKNPLKRDWGFDPNPESPESVSILKETFTGGVLFFNASNMSKDDVLRLEEEASFAPFGGGPKVFIIDEAQALSSAAKGATLKLLEKKRKDVYFILCTMDLNSFDKAIRSRGRVYEFKSPSFRELSDYLFSVLDRKGLLNDDSGIPDSFLTEGLLTLAENTGGSVRDALQQLQRCIDGQLFTRELIRSELGFLSGEEQGDLLSGLLKKDKDTLYQLQQLPMKEQFYLLWRVLTDAYVYRVTGKTNEDWKKARAEKLSHEPNLERLLRAFEETEKNQRGYFRDNFFLSQITSYYLETPSGVQRADPPAGAQRMRVPV